ncbi:MAG: hypothetical protein ACU0DI_08555 [Paracoccaceae bacterium]
MSKLLAKYSKNLVHNNRSTRHEISLIGSCSLVQYRGGCFALATKHQFKQHDRENAALLADYPNHYVTSCGWSDLSAANEGESDGWDLIAFNFTDPVKAGLISSHIFCPFFGSEFVRNGETVNWGIVYGHAFDDQTTHFRADQIHGPVLSHIELLKREIVCEYVGNSYEHSIFLMQAQHISNLNLNGFSGAPTFVLCGAPGDFSVKFGGMVLRAGNGNFHCLKHTRIRRLLDTRLGREKQP